ncbi:hypothetical protein PM082_012312 [Marasmius tenuissimus]|nr:hypothetical protein PM082_012312 [Marasmius tenuissimus]
MMPSYMRAASGFGATIFNEDMVVETQYKWSRMMFDWYRGLYESDSVSNMPRESCQFPVVIDGDKLIHNTESQMRRLCGILGIDPTEIRYSWDPVNTFESEMAEKFVGTIGRSTGVLRQEDYNIPALEEEARKWAEEWDEKTVEKMKIFAEMAMEDYQYLLDRSI